MTGWVLAAGSLAATGLVAIKLWQGWFVGAAAALGWTVYAWVTDQPGMAACNAAYVVVNTVAGIRWIRQRRAGRRHDTGAVNAQRLT